MIASIFIPILSLLLVLLVLNLAHFSGHFQPSLKMASTQKSPTKSRRVGGQIGWDVTGKVVEGIEAQTKLALGNMGHVLQAAGATHKNVTVFLKNTNDAPKMNEVYAKCFIQHHTARAAYEVANLPTNALIEIEAIPIVREIIDSKL